MVSKFRSFSSKLLSNSLSISSCELVRIRYLSSSFYQVERRPRLTFYMTLTVIIFQDERVFGQG